MYCKSLLKPTWNCISFKTLLEKNHCVTFTFMMLEKYWFLKHQGGKSPVTWTILPYYDTNYEVLRYYTTYYLESICLDFCKMYTKCTFLIVRVWETFVLVSLMTLTGSSWQVKRIYLLRFLHYTFVDKILYPHFSNRGKFFFQFKFNEYSKF